MTTTAEGRQTVSTLDEQGRVLSTQITGLHPVTRTYDGQGRLATITHGSRVTAFTYEPGSGFLDAITDAESRVTSFDYDGAGRVTTQTLPDSRVITYGYDDNGNLTSITPPGRPAHGFTYTAVNLEEEYLPPPVVTDPQTTYTYNLDRQLTRIDRPDGVAVELGYDGAGRLQTVTLPGNDVRTYTYHPTRGTLQTLTGPMQR
jgi:YD repeat-containing protein